MRIKINVNGNRTFGLVTEKELSVNCEKQGIKSFYFSIQMLIYLNFLRIIGKEYVFTSTYRTEEYNLTLPGSVKNSKHLKGKAVDIITKDSIKSWFFFDVIEKDDHTHIETENEGIWLIGILFGIWSILKRLSLV